MDEGPGLRFNGAGWMELEKERAGRPGSRYDVTNCLS